MSHQIDLALDGCSRETIQLYVLCKININLQWDLFYLNYWISLLQHRETNNFRHEQK